MFIIVWLVVVRYRRERKRESLNIYFKVDYERDKVDVCLDVCCNIYINFFVWFVVLGDDEFLCVKNNVCVKIFLMKSYWLKEY